MNRNHAKPPISPEKTPDDVCRTAVQLSLSRRGKSIREIAKLCDLGISTTRRHLRSLIAEGHAKQIGCGRGTKYLSRRLREGPGRLGTPSTNPDQITPGQKATPMADRRIEGTSLTHGKADQIIEDWRQSMLKVIQARKRR